MNEEQQISLREEYVARINRVFDYIENHLDEELNLEVIAGVALFSPYHFHRVFRAMTGETINHFVNRLRLEKAAVLLLNQPARPITDIALDCGFSGSSAFARAFKEHFTFSASEWRKVKSLSYSKNSKTKSNIHQLQSNSGEDFRITTSYNILEIRNRRQIMSNLEVKVQELESFEVAYVRYQGPYKGDSELFAGLYEKLFSWAGPRGLLADQDLKVLAVYHDDPEITDEDKLRVSVCVSVPKGTEVGGDIGKMTIAGGKYAMARFEIGENEFEQAWDQVMGEWLPGSGYQPDDRLCFEWYLNDREKHPEKKFILDICVPVKAM